MAVSQNKQKHQYRTQKKNTDAANPSRMHGEHHTAFPKDSLSRTAGRTSQLSQHGVKAFLFVTDERRGNCGKMRRRFQKLGGGGLCWIRNTPFSRNIPHLPETAPWNCPRKAGTHTIHTTEQSSSFFTNLKVTP